MTDNATMRIRAHNVFDTLWKKGPMTRSQAYEWLSVRLDIHPDKCHIALFDVTMCKEVIDTCLASHFKLNLDN